MILLPEITFSNTLTSRDINSLLNCIQIVANVPFNFGYHPVEMIDTQIKSILLQASNVRILPKIKAARIDAAIIGWCCGRGLGYKIDYPELY